MSASTSSPRGRKIAKALAADAKAKARDPIWAAIEAHRTQYIKTAEIGRVACSLYGNDPRYKKANAAISREWRNFCRASRQLCSTSPKTRGGLFALMAYVECFNSGAYVPCKGWTSNPQLWPDPEEEDGEPFGFQVLRNVSAAIHKLAERGRL